MPLTIKNGTAGNDVLTGTTGEDLLNGLDGNDTLKGLAGNDRLNGGGGDDIIGVDAGNDTIDGGTGFDTVSYAGVNASLKISGNNLVFENGVQTDVLLNVEHIIGGAKDDLITGGNSGDTLEGGAGNDVLNGKSGQDVLHGDAGNDQLFAGTSFGTFDGGSGIDTIDYSNGNANTHVDLTGGPTTGSAAGDKLVGIENINGTRFNDELGGNDGANTLFGDQGDDRLIGFGGNDRLQGGERQDIMSGGTGADSFVYTSVVDSLSSVKLQDVITDFNRAQGDKIDLSAIDANPSGGGNDSFEFLGKDALVDAPGQITFHDAGRAGTLIDINTVGGFDSEPEMQIRLAGQVDLKASDFVL